MLANIPDPMYRKELKKKHIPNYLHKLGIIKDCIFGVDIQPIAVEIAKLRCFLSLIVDENVDDEAENRGIEHLPNLEFKFVCANTLIELPKAQTQKGKMRGKKLVESKGQISMFEATEKIEELKELRDLYLTSFGNEKKDIEKRFRKVQSEMFQHDLDVGGQAKQTAKLSQWEPFSDEPSSWFDPDWMYGIKDGFDIAIGNPPYVEHKKLKPFSKIFKENFSCYAGTADLYVYFIEKAISLLKADGTLSYITSNKFIKTSYGEKIRGLLSAKNICKLVDFTEVHVFDALVASCVLIVNNNLSDAPATVAFANDKFTDMSLDNFIKKHHLIIDKTHMGSNIWLLEDSQKLKVKMMIEKETTPLKDITEVQIFRGVTTGYNPAFIIDNETKRELTTKDNINKQIIKPLLQGRNIRKWIYEPSNLYLLQTGYDLNIQKNYHDIYKHLKQFEEELIKRADQGKSWWNLRACKYYGEFEKEKIIWGLTADKWAFAYDDKKYYLPSNGYILTSTGISVKYILAILNSKLMEFYFGFEGIMTAGGAFTLKHETIREFPIKEIAESKQKPFISLVDKLLTAKKNNPDTDTTKLEDQIDQMVYSLYSLTGEEVAIIEDYIK
ncbi:hypothetical protein GF406_18305 [candidate division KSB1 bacterium]|nr:hypothetical protein [candidate division KSB1 bacterium]